MMSATISGSSAGNSPTPNSSALRLLPPFHRQTLQEPRDAAKGGPGWSTALPQFAATR